MTEEEVVAVPAVEETTETVATDAPEVSTEEEGEAAA